MVQGEQIIEASQILRDFMLGTKAPPGKAEPFATWSASLQTALRLLLEAEAQIILFVGPEFLAFYNDAYAPTIGVKHPQVLGRPAHEGWQELWEDLHGLLDKVYSTGETISAKDRPFEIERFGYPETVYFDISYSPVRRGDGTIEAVLCIVSETTTRIEALRSLRENDGRLRAVLSGAAVGLCTISQAGRIISANQVFAEMLDEHPGTLKGRNLRDIVDPRDWRDEWLDRRYIESTRPGAELRYLQRDGRRIWASQSITLGEDAREPEGVVYYLLASDITEQRLKDVDLHRMAAIIEGSDDAILAMDLNMVVTSWNRGAERLYGWHADEMIGHSVLRLLPEGRENEEVAILERIRGGNRVEPYETTRICADSRELPVSLTVSPIYDEAGEICGASKIARDISSRIEAERMQEYLLFEMKHRVKNILATVLALARQSFGRLKHEDYETFTQRVLALSHSQDLLTRKDQTSVSLADLIAEVLAPFNADRFVIMGPVVNIPGEAVLSLTLALHELMTNALKYGALSNLDGRVDIHWELGERGGGSQRVRLTWRERAGPKVERPKHSGFGSVLIRDLLAATLQAKITLTYPPEGVEFSAEFSVKTSADPVAEPCQPPLIA